MLRKLWQRITVSRYTRTLEREVARLRAENRALLNSILGISGIPPIHVDAQEAAMLTDFLSAGAPKPASKLAPNDAPHGASQGVANNASQNNARDSSLALPRPDKPESSTPSRVRFKTDAETPRRAAAPHANPTHFGRFSGQPARRSRPQHSISPMRRRSWQQINRMLEFESAKKKPQET